MVCPERIFHSPPASFLTAVMLCCQALALGSPFDSSLTHTAMPTTFVKLAPLS